MSRFMRAASRLMCGAIFWLCACSLMAGWTLDWPETGTQFLLDEEVDGYGDALGADLTFQFKVLKHGTVTTANPVVIASSGMQSTEDTWWHNTLGPPNEGVWPKGSANTALYSASGLVGYSTIEFMDE